MNTKSISSSIRKFSQSMPARQRIGAGTYSPQHNLQSPSPSPFLGQLEQLEPRLLLSASTELRRLHLIDPTLDRFDDQIIYLDFDGEEDVTYGGPLIIEDFAIPPFVPDSPSEQQHDMSSQMQNQLYKVAIDTGVVFAAAEMPSAVSPIVYTSNIDATHIACEQFIVLAGQVDGGASTVYDETYVFTVNIAQDEIPDYYVSDLATHIAHEVGHLLGYADAFDCGASRVLPDPAEQLVYFRLDVPPPGMEETVSAIPDPPYFTNVASIAGVANGGSGNGALWLDYDNDNDLDIYVVNDPGSAGFYQNRLIETGTPTSQSVSVGVTGNGNWLASADYDKNGYVDIAYGTSSGAILYRNNGAGAFTNANASAGISVTTDCIPVWGDYNNDTHPDLYFGSKAKKLYMNDGNGIFSDVTSTIMPPISAAECQVAWIDYDKDGHDDLFMSPSTGNMLLFHYNSVTGVFDDVSAAAGVNVPSSNDRLVVGDYDGSGYPDMTFADITGLTGLSNTDDSHGIARWLLQKQGLSVENTHVTCVSHNHAASKFLANRVGLLLFELAARDTSCAYNNYDREASPRLECSSGETDGGGYVLQRLLSLSQNLLLSHSRGFDLMGGVINTFRIGWALSREFLDAYLDDLVCGRGPYWADLAISYADWLDVNVRTVGMDRKAALVITPASRTVLTSGSLDVDEKARCVLHELGHYKLNHVADSYHSFAEMELSSGHQDLFDDQECVADALAVVLSHLFGRPDHASSVCNGRLWNDLVKVLPQCAATNRVLRALVANMASLSWNWVLSRTHDYMKANRDYAIAGSIDTLVRVLRSQQEWQLNTEHSVGDLLGAIESVVTQHSAEAMMINMYLSRHHQTKSDHRRRGHNWLLTCLSKSTRTMASLLSSRTRTANDRSCPRELLAGLS